jgi:hypothetical protein
MVPRAADFHHEDNDSTGSVSASAIASLSSTLNSFAQTFGPFKQMVKLHLARETWQRTVAVRVAWLPDAGRVANGGD